MNGSGRLASILLLGLLAGAPGCYTHAPSYFPYLLPFGTITETHAKPVGPGYNANFDPHAFRLEVRPIKDSTGQDIASQARTQYALLATVYDEKGSPRRDRRIEWMIEGTGHILEVDENGWLPGRGYKTSDKHAVSYTNRSETRINRGDKDKANDFMVRPGQTWCVLSSAIEGDTHVTVYAPGIYDWEKNKAYTTIRWVDAVWEFPQPAQKAAGSEHTFVTRLARATTKAPLAGYRVRYRIKDGPAAYFLPDKTQEFTAISDLSGNAEARITQVRLGDQVAPPGINTVDIEVVRPPDGNSGSGIVIARGTSSVEWLAPNVVLSYTGPAGAMVGEEVTYTASLQNLGKVASEGITLTAPAPRGMEFVRSNPPAMGNVGNEMLFTLGSLQPGAAAANVQLTFRAKELGQTTSAITIKSGGQTDTKQVVTNIANAKLDVFIDGPPRAVVNQPIPLTIRVVNAGGGALEGVVLSAVLKGGLVDPTSNTTAVKQEIKQPLAPGGTFTAQLNVVPKMKGRAEVQVIAANATIAGSANYAVDVSEPMVNLQIDGPRQKYIGRDAEYTIRVTNPGDTPLTGVMVRNQLPPELEFITAQNAAGNGQLQGREVVWSLGSLAAGASLDLRLVAKAKSMANPAVQNVVVTSENAGPANQSWETKIFGAAGLRLELHDQQDPVPAGGKVVYEVIITNTGTDVATNVALTGQIAGGLSGFLESAGPSQMSVVPPNGFSYKAVSLKPGERAVYLINVQAGNNTQNGVLRIILTADNLKDGNNQPLPVVEEENTTIYAPNAVIGPGGAPGVPPPPPAPNNGGLPGPPPPPMAPVGP